MTLQEQRSARSKARSGKAASHAGVDIPGSHTQLLTTTTTSTAIPYQRDGDRSSGDDRARHSVLPTFVRYNDLVAARIVGNWTTLLRLIETEHFPPGILIGPNTRAWRVDEIEAWLDARPSAKKILPPGAIPPRGRKRITKHEGTL